jgi:hypothetical protein
MSDPLAKQAYQQVSDAGIGGFPSSNTPANEAFVFRLKAVKDEYYNYVLTLRRGTTWAEFGSDSAKPVLDSLVAVTVGAATKAPLGAASAGVTGATTSFNKNVLFDQSITTFITKMDTLRLNKWNDILCKLGRCSDCQPYTYTMAEAFVDMEEYGHCGILDAALRASPLRQAKKIGPRGRLTLRSMEYRGSITSVISRKGIILMPTEPFPTETKEIDQLEAKLNESFPRREVFRAVYCDRQLTGIAG